MRGIPGVLPELKWLNSNISVGNRAHDFATYFICENWRESFQALPDSHFIWEEAAESVEIREHFTCHRPAYDWQKIEFNQGFNSDKIKKVLQT
jgi:hypothetical protein